MARGRARRGAGPKKHKDSIPKQVAGTTCVVRRVVNSAVTRPAVDGGFQFGTVPANVVDWASFQAVFARYRLLHVTHHFVVGGEYDGTPAYPTLFIYHDLASVGAPANLGTAFLSAGVKALSFNASVNKRSFTFVPLAWTSAGFTSQVPAPRMYCQTSAAFAPTFSSCAAWALNYNNISNAASLTLLTEYVVEFSQPI